MNPFTFHAPTQVDFGDGVRHLLRERLESGAWGVLSSPSVLAHSGIAEALDACSTGGGIEVVSLGHVSPNPRLSEIEAGLQLARQAGIDGVVAVGGGSVLDAAKLLRVAVAHGASGREALEDLPSVLGRPAPRRIPLVAIPTTAGTGAEVSRGAIITDDETGAKKAARGQALVPDFALVDPELTRSLPPRRTAETGFDVIAHAVETFLSRVATPITDILARAALAEVPSALLAVMEDGQNASARRTLTLHSWLMGYNLAHASTCLPHRLQYPIGSATDTSHQIGLAALYPTWLRHLEPAAPERASEVAAAMSRGLGEDSGMTASEAMAAYLERLDIRVGLKDLGLTRADLPDLAGAVTGRTDLDPIQPDAALISAIFEESYDV